MNFKKNINHSLLGIKNEHLTSNLLIISLAIGAGIGYYFLKKIAHKTKPKSQNEFGASVNDIRKDIKSSSKNLLGDYDDNHDPIKINVPEAGTLAWKKNRDRSMFPPIPDPNIKIN
jgi:hypothetical protein